MPYDLIPDEFPVLRREGLTLRELSEEDLPAWFGRLSDAEAAALAGDPVATSMQDVIDGLEFHRKAFREKEGLRWSIVPDEVGGSVGSIGFGSLDPQHRSAGIGGAVGRAHWNQGFATSAGRLIVNYGFETLQLERIQAEILTTNAPSIRVVEKLGFEREGLLRGYRIINDTRRDFFVYALLRS